MSWKRCDIASVVSVLESGSRPKGGASTESGEIPSLGGENILRSGGVTLHEVKRVPRKFYEKMDKGHLLYGDVLINKDGAQTGKVGLYAQQNSKPSCINEHLFLIRGNSQKITQEYLYYTLLSQPSQNQIDAQMSGSAQPGLKSDFLSSVFAKIPDTLSEQIKIAEILSTVDQAIDQTEALIAKQQRIKTGLMQDLLMRGIDEEGNLRSEDAHEFKDSPLGRIPVEWDVKLLKEITKKIADRDHTTPEYVEDGILIISPMAFYDDEGIDFSKCPRISRKAHLINSQKTDCCRGDLILHRIGAGLGGVRVVLDSHPEYSLLHSLALIRPDGLNAETSYLKWAFRSSDIQKQMRLGTQSIGVPDLGLEKIGSLLFRIPTTLREQYRIGAIIDSNQSQIDSLLINRKKLFKIKTALMQDLLTGKVSVTPLITKEKIDV